MKKILLLLLAIVVSLTTVITSVVSIQYFSTSIPGEKCVEYCKENTERNATIFECLSGDPRYTESYLYWVAGDGDSTKPQEIFIFKEKFLLNEFDFLRREFVASSTQSESLEDDKGVNSFEFFTFDDKNKKEDVATRLYYGSLNELNVFWYECTVSISGKIETFKGKVMRNDNTWMLRSFDISETGNIIDLKLYDYDRNLLYES